MSGVSLRESMPQARPPATASCLLLVATHTEQALTADRGQCLDNYLGDIM